MHEAAEFSKDLVLVGGGHSHALALRMLAMHPIAGLRITLISPDSHTPYSGMLPGLVAGHYSFEQTHIDLFRLCQWAGVRFLSSQVTAVDTANKVLTLRGRPPVAYDLLSLDIGSQPELDSVPGAREHAVPVKPVASLWQRWQTFEGGLKGPVEMSRVAVVGGGAGSVELILAMAHRLQNDDMDFQLYCGAAQLLQGYNTRASAAVCLALQTAGVSVNLNARVEQVVDGELLFTGGGREPYDQLFWCTGAAAAPWIESSGLAVTDSGFLAVRDTLQALNDDSVFGVGDIAVQVDNPRPRAGVFAVRQAPVLAHNLRAALMAQPLREHKPQQRFLSLLSLGGRSATADKGLFNATGQWVWRWKDRIDGEFMGRFEQLPVMKDGSSVQHLPSLDSEPQAHCGGCGAKVGADALARVLSQLREEFPEVCLDETHGDDAALIPGSDAGPIWQSLDVLRQVIDDPWVMGRIAANHALSDLYACGAQPVSALAAITLPFASASLQQRELKQILSGALHEFAQVGCRLSGGHSMQGPELSVGFAVNGRAQSDSILSKRGLQPGNKLILTKALGVGVLMAAYMQQAADGRHVAGALAMMLQSNAAAGALAVEFSAAACTDITGFGLLGHLLEMLEESQSARLSLAKLPVLPGALAVLNQGIRSTMHSPNHRSAAQRYSLASDALAHEILFDPQTSGGLLISVASGRVDALLVALRSVGYEQAAVVGEVTERTTDAASVEIMA
jgi:selenide,water dikinase